MAARFEAEFCMWGAGTGGCAISEAGFGGAGEATVAEVAAVGGADCGWG